MAKPRSAPRDHMGLGLVHARGLQAMDEPTVALQRSQVALSTWSRPNASRSGPVAMGRAWSPSCRSNLSRTGVGAPVLEVWLQELGAERAGCVEGAAVCEVHEEEATDCEPGLGAEAAPRAAAAAPCAKAPTASSITH